MESDNYSDTGELLKPINKKYNAILYLTPFFLSLYLTPFFSFFLGITSDYGGFIKKSLTNSSIGPPKVAFFCVCRKLHVTQKNATSGGQ